MKLLILLLMFFTLSSLLIITNYNLSMQKQENIEKFYDLYLEWVDNIYSNSQFLTGNIIKLDWFPK